MERSNGDWSCLSGPVIDSLFAAVRRLGRWEKDGWKLRLLNKHWCKHTDLWITHIRLTERHRYYGNEIESLSKFVNLRHLRLDPFLKKLDSGSVVSIALRHLTCLRSLGHLTDLELRGSVPENVRSCPSGCFQNVTSIVFDDAGLCEGKSIALLQSSPIHSMTFIGTVNRKYIKYPWTSTLRSLEFVTDSVCPFFVESITQLGSLTSLSLSSRLGEALVLDSSKKLSRLASLVSLHLPDSEIRLPLWMTILSNLESLSLRISEFESNEERLWTLLENFHSLKSLVLPQRLIKEKRFLKFFGKARELRSLEFSPAPTMKEESFSLLSQLTRLVTDLDETTTGLRNLVGLPLLQELSLIGTRPLESIFDENHARSLNNLIVLEIDWYVSADVFEEITLIQTLEKLCLYSFSPESTDGVLELRKLPNLKELCLIGSFYRRRIKRTRKLVSFLDSLELLCVTRATHSIYTHNWIYWTLPHVKVTDSLEKFLIQSRVGQKRRRLKLEEKG